MSRLPSIDVDGEVVGDGRLSVWSKPGCRRGRRSPSRTGSGSPPLQGCRPLLDALFGLALIGFTGVTRRKRSGCCW